MNPSPQAAEAAEEISDELCLLLSKGELRSVAAIIDRAFSARIEAADKMEKEMQRYGVILDRLHTNVVDWVVYSAETGLASTNGYNHALKNYAAAKAKPERTKT